MTDGSLERSIGKISGQLEDVIRRLDKADESRGKMYERFDRHNSDVAELRRHTDQRFDGLEIRVGKIEEQMERIIVVVGRVETYETQGKTVVTIGSVVGARLWKLAGAVAIVIAAFWREIIAFLKGLT